MIKSALVFSDSLIRFIIFADENASILLNQIVKTWPLEILNRMHLDLREITFPSEKMDEWKKLFKLCASQRLFIPSVLKEVDSVLYVDTDTVFLAPPSAVWEHFSHFNSSQMAALSPEHEDRAIGWYNRFARHPYYGDLGVNSGVMLMNLTRMRMFSWENVGGKPVTTLLVDKNSSVKELKTQVHKFKRHLHPDRQEFRLEPRGKGIEDSKTVNDLGLKNGSSLYLKDLGPQIGYQTVFIIEYAGPLFVYAWIYQRPWLFYGDGAAEQPMNQVVHIAAICWIAHYAKRILETLFIHRFSHATMPLRNLFRNCSYYWIFAAYVAYHVNHPLYTAPCPIQSHVALGVWAVCELGNLSIHWLLRNLRPPGTKERRIPRPTKDPLTWMFNLVSCPNYTYEFGGWVAFTVMTQCLPAGLFALAGFYQMAVWALGKHRAYKRDFKDYPSGRKAILPFVL
nr:EOG090X097L [Macrothrix elegans]